MSSSYKKLFLAKGPISRGKGKLDTSFFKYRKSRLGKDEVITWSEYLFPSVLLCWTFS
jgi:hypothetical protein